MNIVFSHAVAGIVESETFTLRMSVKVDGKPVRCAISQEALQDHFGAGAGAHAMVDAFNAHRATIEAKAQAKLLENGGEPVLLRTVDF